MFSEARLRQRGIDVGAPRGFPSIGVVFSELHRSLPPAGTFSGCPASASSPGTGRRCRKGRKRRGWRARRPGQLQSPCFRAFAWGPVVQGAARTADRHVRRARRAIPRGSGSRLHWQWAPLERGRFLLRLLPSWARRCAGPVPGAQPWDAATRPCQAMRSSGSHHHSGGGDRRWASQCCFFPAPGGPARLIPSTLHGRGCRGRLAAFGTCSEWPEVRLKKNSPAAHPSALHDAVAQVCSGALTLQSGWDARRQAAAVLAVRQSLSGEALRAKRRKTETGAAARQALAMRPSRMNRLGSRKGRNPSTATPSKEARPCGKPPGLARVRDSPLASPCPTMAVREGRRWTNIPWDGRNGGGKQAAARSTGTAALARLAGQSRQHPRPRAGTLPEQTGYGRSFIKSHRGNRLATARCGGTATAGGGVFSRWRDQCRSNGPQPRIQLVTTLPLSLQVPCASSRLHGTPHSVSVDPRTPCCSAFAPAVPSGAGLHRFGGAHLLGLLRSMHRALPACGSCQVGRIAGRFRHAADSTAFVPLVRTGQQSGRVAAFPLARRPLSGRLPRHPSAPCGSRRGCPLRHRTMPGLRQLAMTASVGLEGPLQFRSPRRVRCGSHWNLERRNEKEGRPSAPTAGGARELSNSPATESGCRQAGCRWRPCA